MLNAKSENKLMSEDPNIFIVRKRVTFPQNLKYYCPAFPPRRGYITVSMGGNDYKMFTIASGKTFELVYPKAQEDGWIPTCVEQYIGPDLIMVSDHCYTTYVKLL